MSDSGVSSEPGQNESSAPGAPEFLARLREEAAPDSLEFGAASVRFNRVEITDTWLSQAPEPLARRAGVRAELGWLEGRIAEAKQIGDLDGEREASVQLARLLFSHGIDFGSALQHARRALLLGEDPELREELSRWFNGVGEFALAAGTLRPLTHEGPQDQVLEVLLRIALLQARAGKLQAASGVLEEASLVAPDSAEPLELLGSLGRWPEEAVADESAGVDEVAQEDGVSAEDASRAYLRAAVLRQSGGDWAAAFANLLCAFELAPGHAAAARALADALNERGRGSAADEVLREHAKYSREKSKALHSERVKQALTQGDLAAALGASFDLGLEEPLQFQGGGASYAGVFAEIPAAGRDGSPQGASLDEVLVRCDLHELVAARMLLQFHEATHASKAALGFLLGKLYLESLGSAERAIEVWVAAFVAEPGHTGLADALREHGQNSGDLGVWVEALVRLGRHYQRSSRGEFAASWLAAFEASMRELAHLAEQRLSDPGLALWAANLLAPFAGEEEMEPLMARLRPRARLQWIATDNARVSLQNQTGAERLPALRKLIAITRYQPELVEEHLELLGELSQLVPDERATFGQMERLLEREQRSERLLELWQAQLSGNSRLEMERARNRLASFNIAQAQHIIALGYLEPLLEAGAGQRAAWCLALALGVRVGARKVQARSLERLAQSVQSRFRGVFWGLAAEAWLGAEVHEAAFEAAKQAKAADPASAWVAAIAADCALKQPDEQAAPMIEQALGVVTPRARWCRGLAEALERMGELPAAIAWTQRHLALCPGDPAVARALLDRLILSGNHERLADVLSWVLTQGQLLRHLEGSLARALKQLAREEPSRALVFARRILDIYGPQVGPLKDALLELAEDSGRQELAVNILERLLAAPRGGAGVNLPLLLELVRRRLETGKVNLAARNLLAAVKLGAEPGWALQELSRLEAGPLSPDGELCCLEARARVQLLLAELSKAELGAGSEPDFSAAVLAFRKLGAAYWDLAGSQSQAIFSWESAANLEPNRGLVSFAHDVLSFAGQAASVAYLRRFAEGRSELDERVKALWAAAELALKFGDKEQALQLGLECLSLDPRRGELLSVIERAVGASEPELLALERAYQQVAEASLGRYGERAVYYRAAKNIERRGDLTRALSHAVRAFEAVPAQGVTFLQMMRLAERAGEPMVAVEALERVAALSGDELERAEWLEQAALFAGSGEEGQRQRLEVLLRALALRPELDTLRSLEATFNDLCRLLPEERDVFELRLRNALGGLRAQLGSTEQPELGVLAAELALRSMGSAELGFKMLRQTADLFPMGNEFERLSEYTEQLCGANRLADEWLDWAWGAREQLGASLLSLAAALANSRGAKDRAASFLVDAAQLEPASASLQSRAAASVAELEEQPELAALGAELRHRLSVTLSPDERALELLERGREFSQRQEFASAAASLEQALAVKGASNQVRRGVRWFLKDVYAGLGQREKQLEQLQSLLADEAQPLAERVTLTRDLARVRAEQADRLGAIGLLRQLLSEPHEGVERDELLNIHEDMVKYARDGFEPAQQLASLRVLSERAEKAEGRASALRELAQALEAERDWDGAVAAWEQLLKQIPADEEAFEATLRIADGQADFERVIQILERRASLLPVVDAGPLRLRRAQILERELGRADEAVRELERMVQQTGDLDATCSLARLHEQLGAPLKAAPLWWRASSVVPSRPRATALAKAACEAYLSGDDAVEAQRVLDQARAWIPAEELGRLRVQVARRYGDQRLLADALEEFALSSMAPPEQRASLLVESAQTSERGGDLKLALARAQQAARIAPLSVEPQLYARYLEYRVRGVGTTENARVALAELRGTVYPQRADEVELRAFLIAESLEALQEQEASMRELQRAHAEVGALPLIGLGLAERLLAKRDPARALGFFSKALAGDLRQLRAPGEVALRAAEVALSVNEREEASRLLELAAGYPESRAESLQRQVELWRLEAGSQEAVSQKLRFSDIAQLAPPNDTAQAAEPLVTSGGAAATLAHADEAALQALAVPAEQAVHEAPPAEVTAVSAEKRAPLEPAPPAPSSEGISATQLPPVEEKPRVGQSVGVADLAAPKPVRPSLAAGAEGLIHGERAAGPPPEVQATEELPPVSPAFEPDATGITELLGEASARSPRQIDELSLGKIEGNQAAPGFTSGLSAPLSRRPSLSEELRVGETQDDEESGPSSLAQALIQATQVVSMEPPAKLDEKDEPGQPSPAGIPSQSRPSVPPPPRVALTPPAPRVSAPPPAPRVSAPPLASRVSAPPPAPPAAEALPLSVEPPLAPLQPLPPQISLGENTGDFVSGSAPEGDAEEAEAIQLSRPKLSVPPPEAPRSERFERQVTVLAKASFNAPKHLLHGFVTQGAEERQLLDALLAGKSQAGRELLAKLEAAPERLRDRLILSRELMQREPGERSFIEAAQRDAQADKNTAYAQALAHVLGVFDGEAVLPPELELQQEQPERVQQMLFGERPTPIEEVLALVWEGAQHIFRKDASAYGVTGLERVPLHAATSLGQIYSAAARHLGVSRTPLFQKKQLGKAELGLALLSPPAVLFVGDTSRLKWREFSYRLGVMLAASFSKYVLFFGQEPEQLESLLYGIGLAFGPAGMVGAHSPEQRQAAAHLAEKLWESMPPSSQRRLRELCEDPSLFDFRAGSLGARCAVRRAGLFVSGDLELSLTAALAEEGIRKTADFATVCREQPVAQDLVRLATSLEYADARWGVMAPRRRPTWSIF